jgi:hypothetical protein
MLADLEIQCDAARKSAEKGYFATARGQLNGAKWIIDGMERAQINGEIPRKTA